MQERVSPYQPRLPFSTKWTERLPFFVEKPQSSEGIIYNTPRVHVVQFFLDRGAGPNNLDGNQTISLYTLTSMHMVAARSGTAFSKQAKQWFEVTKLIILLHVASTDVICPISIKSRKVEGRVNLRKIT